MRAEEELTFYYKVMEDGAETLKRKSHDYATDDVLSNFKRGSKLVKILGIDMTTPEGVAMYLTVLKIDRICNLVFAEKAPMNESLEDSFRDLRNYAFLMQAILVEKSNEESF